MSGSYGKRQREPSDDGGRPIKREASNKMVEDFLESMDPSVRIKLRSMFDDGLLMYSDLDERNIAELSKFDASVALEILEHYCSGDLTQVRNRRAYLAGAIKRRVHMVRDSYEPTPLAPDGMPLLVPEVQRKFDQVKAMSPKVGELDQRSLDALAAMPHSRALAALDRFGSMDFSAVRNPSALFMSIVRTIMESGDSGNHGPPMGGGYRPAPIYGPPAAPPPPPPPPPPRRPAPQYAAAAGSLPPGTIITPGPGGGLVLAGSGLVGGIAGLPAALPTLGGVGAAASGLVLAAAPGAGGVPQYMLVNTSAAAQGVPGGAQVLAPQAGQVLAAPQVINMQPQQQQAVPSVQAVQAAAAAPAAAAVPEGVPPDWAAGRKNYGTEQGQLGVRVSEFHDLSPFAVFVHPSPALKLQQLWDNGNELVSMLDDKVWQVLAEMPAPEGLAAIQEAADALDNPDSTIRNINAFFMSVVKKVWPTHGMQPRGAAGTSSGPGSGDYYSQQRGPPRGPYGGRGGAGSRGSGDWGSEGGGPQQQQHHHSREPAIHLLPPEQRLLAQSLCKTHAPLLREDHFDEGVIDSLRRLSHEEGIAVLHELGHNSMSGVRNMPAYIMGIAKRYASGQRGPAGRVQQPHEVVI